LSFGNLTTDTAHPIVWSPSALTLASNIQAALSTSAMFGPGNVQVTPVFATATATTTSVYSINFRGALANAHLTQITGTGITFTGTGVNAGNFVAGTTAFTGTGNEVQTISIADLIPNATTGGTVQLSFNGVPASQPLTFVPFVAPTIQNPNPPAASPTAAQV